VVLYRDSNPGITNPDHFRQSRIPGLEVSQSRDFGITKIG